MGEVRSDVSTDAGLQGTIVSLYDIGWFVLSELSPSRSHSNQFEQLLRSNIHAPVW
jgi:hypothetical protein